MNPTRREILTALWAYLEERLAAEGIPLIAALSREQALPHQALVLGLGSFMREGEGLRQHLGTWDLSLIALGEDVFQAASVLDALEAACDEWRQGEGVAAHVRALRYVGHEELDLDIGRVAARALVQVHLVRR